MARNVEIKARARDPDALLERARSIGGGAALVMAQEDVFFDVPRGRLKLRASGGEGQLILYERPDATGPKVSRYHVVPIGEPGPLRALLADALGEIAVVRKRRTLVTVGQTRVHVDRVEGLGDFMELEVVLREDQDAEEGFSIARDVMAALGIEERDLVAGAYVDLLTGRSGGPGERGERPA